MADIKYSLKNSMGFASGKLFLNDELADVNFIFEINGEIQKVPAHKLFLAVLSPVFKAMFFGPMKEEGDVTIVDATIDAFKEFLQFFYLPEVKLSMEHMREVARLADKYDVSKHIAHCVQMFNTEITLDNVCWAYQLSIMISDAANDLKRVCENYIMGYTKDIFDSNAFCRCDPDALKEILQLDSMTCNEFDVLYACIKWAKFACQRDEIDENQPENWRKQLDDCFELIRFGSMDTKEFVAHTVSYRTGLFTPNELVEILLSGFEQQSKPKQEPRSKPIFYSELLEEFFTIGINDTDTSVCLFPNTRDAGVHWLVREQDNQMLFSTSTAVLLGEIWLKNSLSTNASVSNLKLEVKIFEYDVQSFEESVGKTMVFDRVVDVNVSQGVNKFKCISRINVLLNPRKMYKITWKVVFNSHGAFYYGADEYCVDREIKIDDKLTVLFPDEKDTGEYINFGLLHRLTFKHIHRLHK